MSEQKNFTAKDGVSLEKYLEAQCLAYRTMVRAEIEALAREMDVKFAARDKAVDVAFEALTAKMLTENGIREQLRQQADTLVGKAEYEGTSKQLGAEVRLLREAMAGKLSTADLISLQSDVKILRERTRPGPRARPAWAVLSLPRPSRSCR